VEQKNKSSNMETNFKKYLEGYTNWMKLLNYDNHSCQSNPVMVERFLQWMTEHEARTIEDITTQKVKAYFEVLSQQISNKTGEVLSINTLRTHLTAIKRLAKYLQSTDQGNIDIAVHYKGKSNHKIEVLTRQEIDQIYEAADDSLLGMRDRAMIAIFYGCGARRNEGLNIKINDILPDKNLLYIRKGKNYKERYIPMIGQVKKDIINYLTMARPMLMNKEIHDTFFVSMTGKRMSSQSLYQRVKQLTIKARIEKNIGLHTLRHSIATHLHQGGMKLTEIAKFLGHSSLESTQIYTHITND
jgi:integrase/recombinase XerD